MKMKSVIALSKPIQSNNVTSNVMNLEPLIPQVYRKFVKDFLRERHTEYVMKGGRGSIKSTIASYLVVLTVLNGYNGVCVRRYKTTLRGSCFADILVAIERLGVEHEFEYTTSPLQVKHRSGRVIEFRGLDDPQKMKSLKATISSFGVLWFEETQEIEGYQKCRSAIQTVARGGQHCNIVYSFNPPPSVSSWVNKDLGVINKISKLVLHTSYLDIPPEWLGKQFIDIAEELKEVNFDAYRNEYLGEAAGSKGMVFPNVRPLKPNMVYDVSTVYRGNDFGFTNDPNAYVAWYYDKKQHILVLKHSIFKYSLTTKDLASEIRSENVHNFTVKCDSAEPRSISDLITYGLIGAIACTKGADSVRHGVKWLQSLRGIYIDTSTDQDVYREFSTYEYIMNKNGEYTGNLPDKDNHSIDATRYACEDLIRGYV